MSADKERTDDGNRSLKRRLVDKDRAHAALVLDCDDVVAWCEYGSLEELPNIYHRKQYEEEPGDLHDPDGVAAAYLIAASVLQL